jgi:D-cysteine desulfhydrase family pyridoxal phosphate-dependent enzyme
MTLPRINFAHLPTQVEAMPRLSAHLNGPQLFVKRDDQTGLGMGGNKTRKLEFVLAQALDAGAKTLITVGGIQSNHCRQTAALAAKFGLKCILVLSGEEPNSANGNLLLDDLFDASVVWTTRDERNDALEKVFQQSAQRGEAPFLIPLGASTAVGAVGYVEAMREFVSQEQDFNWIIVASSSGGTQAGMVLGAELTHWNGRILGISIDHTIEELQSTVSSLANETAALLKESVRFTMEQILVNADYLGGGYAVAGSAEVEAIKLFGKSEGLLLDPVYTGRAAAGMMDLIREGFFKQTDRVLFWHTGGAPALFAPPYSQLLSTK